MSEWVVGVGKQVVTVFKRRANDNKHYVNVSFHQDFIAEALKVGLINEPLAEAIAQADAGKAPKSGIAVLRREWDNVDEGATLAAELAEAKEREEKLLAVLAHLEAQVQEQTEVSESAQDKAKALRNEKARLRRAAAKEAKAAASK